MRELCASNLINHPIPMTDLKEFDQYYKLADKLIDEADKEQVAEFRNVLI